MPRTINGIAFLAGAEANILPDGTIDIPEKICENLDLIVASIHTESFPKTTMENVADAYMKILQNPYVNILGHIGTETYKFDYEKIISKCNEYKKIIEINNNSFKIRKGSYENCLEIAKLCKKHNVEAEVFKSNCLDNVNGKFDLIVTNPPIRAGKDVVYKIFEQAKNHLNVNGEFWLIIQYNHGAPSAIKKLKEIYANCEVVYKKKGFYIVRNY